MASTHQVTMKEVNRCSRLEALPQTKGAARAKIQQLSTPVKAMLLSSRGSITPPTTRAIQIAGISMESASQNSCTLAKFCMIPPLSEVAVAGAS